jgi:outer membrane receptor for ferrienterochelin and colicins
MKFLNIATLIFLFLFLAPPRIHAQDHQVSGKLVSEEEPVVFANILVRNTSMGTSSNEEGVFALSGLAAGLYELDISALGYRRKIVPVEITPDRPVDLGEIELKTDQLGLDAVVVTGAMKESYVKSSPLKVEVFKGQYLQRQLAPTNLMESLSLINGAQEVTACGVCGTNSISLNGLPGAYTAVLLDGSPIYGSLASVYGLNGIPSSLIEQIEVVKGPQSTLYGSEAMAGVINIITRDAEELHPLNFDLRTTSLGEVYGNLVWTPDAGKSKGYLGLDLAHNHNFTDQNGDGFGDFVQFDRLSLFTKWDLPVRDGDQLTVAGKLFYEDRYNGVQAFVQDRAYRQLRGDDAIYGESIYTYRGEAMASYRWNEIWPLQFDLSLSHHRQNSYYGADLYQATQSTGFANAYWSDQKGKHSLLGGFNLRYQYYDDNTQATVRGDQNMPNEQWIPGLFFQDEWLISDRFTALTGLRLDYFPAHGLIPAPRLNVKWKTSEWTSFRLGFGTGFRIVNLFTEDHAFVTGQRKVHIVEDLKPEQAYNGTLNFRHIYLLGEGQGNLDIDLHYTRFTNKIIPDYDTPGQIVYANTKGHAVSKGVALQLNHQFAKPLTVTLGANLQSVTRTEPDDEGIYRTEAIEFAPEWSGNLGLNYEWEKTGLELAYTLQQTGPMALPEVFDLDAQGRPLDTPRPTRSPTFALHQLQATKSLGGDHWQIYAGVKNLLDHRQSFSPLIAYDDPNFAPGFSPYFDTAYAYGPMQGRTFFLGVRYN